MYDRSAPAKPLLIVIYLLVFSYCGFLQGGHYFVGYIKKCYFSLVIGNCYVTVWTFWLPAISYISVQGSVYLRLCMLNTLSLHTLCPILFKFVIILGDLKQRIEMGTFKTKTVMKLLLLNIFVQFYMITAFDSY